MAEWFRFYVRSKVAKGGSGWGIGFADDNKAKEFCTALNANLANNAKCGCIKTVEGVKQADYELPAEPDLTASCTATYLLLAEDNSGTVLAKKWVKIPGVKVTHTAHVDFDGAQIFDPAGNIHDVTRVIHVSDKYKDITGTESDGEGNGSVDGNYGNDEVPWQNAA